MEISSAREKEELPARGSKNLKIAPAPPQSTQPNSIRQRWSASSRKENPRWGRDLCADMRTVHLPLALRHRVPQMTARQKAKAVRPQSTQRKPNLQLRQPPPFRLASEIFPCQPWCRLRWRTQPTGPSRVSARVFPLAFFLNPAG